MWSGCKHIPSGEVTLELGPWELSPNCSLFSCSASCPWPLVSSAVKTECQVLSATPVPGSPFSHVLRTARHASVDCLGLFPLTLSIRQDSTPRQSATCSQFLVQRTTMSLSSSWSAGLELILRRLWVPEQEKLVNVGSNCVHPLLLAWSGDMHPHNIDNDNTLYCKCSQQIFSSLITSHIVQLCTLRIEGYTKQVTTEQHTTVYIQGGSLSK